LGSTSIQRGWSRPVANALTLSPGAATGVCPTDHPLAVGIFNVGMAPCGFAAGIAGLLPQAGSCSPSVSRRNCSAVPPTSATTREKTAEKLNSLSPWSDAPAQPKVHQNLWPMMLPVMSWDSPPLSLYAS
jgi:hypothetical protein